MQPISITQHSVGGWQTYADRVGFVPDPMILRAGQIFLNGRSGSLQLQRDENEVWHALEQNLAGLVQFFDMVVTRETIPLIDYGETFNPATSGRPLEDFLPDRMLQVHVGYDVYHTVKQGALLGLAMLDPDDLRHFGQVLREIDAFRYDWKPELDIPDRDPQFDGARAKLARIQEPALTVAKFLLGGLIFSGFAQASRTTHDIQPKRSRILLGLTAARREAGYLSNVEEGAIFAAAEEQLHGSVAEVRRPSAIPPVLPFLLAPSDPKSVAELLDRALAFRETPKGKAYREFVAAVRADGIDARRAEDVSDRERARATEFLTPYAKLDPEKSRSLDVKLSSDLVGVPGAEIAFKASIPTWLRVWWNDRVPFGGIRKTLRRMWMAEESYRDLAAKLRAAWARS